MQSSSNIFTNINTYVISLNVCPAISLRIKLSVGINTCNNTNYNLTGVLNINIPI